MKGRLLSLLLLVVGVDLLLIGLQLGGQKGVLDLMQTICQSCVAGAGLP